jgi:hypothetical protein
MRDGSSSSRWARNCFTGILSDVLQDLTTPQFDIYGIYHGWLTPGIHGKSFHHSHLMQAKRAMMVDQSKSIVYLAKELPALLDRPKPPYQRHRAVKADAPPAPEQTPARDGQSNAAVKFKLSNMNIQDASGDSDSEQARTTYLRTMIDHSTLPVTSLL